MINVRRFLSLSLEEIGKYMVRNGWTVEDYKSFGLKTRHNESLARGIGLRGFWKKGTKVCKKSSPFQIHSINHFWEPWKTYTITFYAPREEAENVQILYITFDIITFEVVSIGTWRHRFRLDKKKSPLEYLNEYYVNFS